MLTSQAASSRLKPKARTAETVYGPTPGSELSAFASCGNVPPYFSHTASASFFSRIARELYPSPFPLPENVGERRFCKHTKIWKPFDKRFEFWNHPVNLRLLEHRLAYDGIVRVLARSPRKVVPAVFLIPRQQFLHHADERSA